MKFGEKLKLSRDKKKMTQEELAKRLGISKQAIIKYEVHGIYPRKREVYTRLAEIFDMDVNYFISEEEDFALEATEKYGSKGAKDAEKILQQTNALFAGGDLDEEDRDKFFKVMTEIYFDSKLKAKKYTPKKYLKDE